MIYDANDTDVVFPMYDLLYCSKNYKKNNNRDRFHYSIRDSESFNYKTSNTGKLEANQDELEGAKIVVPLKNLSNFLDH